ncbi:MAG TPA: hypothetical protein VI542_33140 [Candidatus Tectomicrobia bacterium]
MLRTLPKKLPELGRIRIGMREVNKNGRGSHPAKIENFRLTSPNPSLLHFAASAYGGDVHPWVGEGAPVDEHKRPTQHELYTNVNTLDVLIPTFSAVSISFEVWSGGGCQRRCSGEFVTHCATNEGLVGAECVCPADDLERMELAKTGKACARILRLNVLLPDMPGMGVWRLETKGYYATAELMGTLEMLQMSGQEHSIIEASLRLEQRIIKRPGTGEGKGTMRFAVPVLWPKFTPRQMLSAAAERGTLLMTPAPQRVPQATLIAELAGGMESDDDPLVERVNVLLAEQGVSVEERKAWWVKMDKKYAGRSPITLTILYEQLLEQVEQRRAKAIVAAQEDDSESYDDLPEVEEATASSGASWGPESPNLFEDEDAAARGED